VAENEKFFHKRLGKPKGSVISALLTKGHSAFTRYGGRALEELPKRQRVGVALRGARITVCFSTLASIITVSELLSYSTRTPIKHCVTWYPKLEPTVQHSTAAIVYNTIFTSGPSPTEVWGTYVDTPHETIKA
jgi:hypothetical protein